MANPPADRHLSGRLASDPSSGTEIALQRAACERCRGQKLRCTRTYDSRAACNRCERAGAQCIVNPVLRMGRPLRLEPSSSQQKPPNEHPERSGTSSASNEWPPQTSGSFDDVCLPLSAPSAPSPPQPVHSAQPLCMNSQNGLAHDLAQDDVDLFGMVSFFGEDTEGTFGASPPTPRSIDLLKPSPESYMTCINLQHGAYTRPLDPTSPTGHQDQFENELPSAQSTAPTQNRSGMSSSTDMCGFPLEQLSRLNLEFHRQWSQTKVMANGTPRASSSQDLDSLLPISLLIRGLHRFQDLLQECSAFASSNVSPARAQRGSNLTGWEAWSGLDDDVRPPKRPRASCSASSGTSRSFETPTSPSSLTTLTQSSPAISLSDASRPYGGPKSLGGTSDRKHVARPLDMPTGMLLITCYINLTRFCRSVFHNIRQCLLTLDQEIIFARLPDLAIGGVSLQQDGLLQILVLIQVVSGMLDTISTSLGYSKDYRILTGSLQQRDTSSIVSEISTTPKLMESVMREDEMSKVQDASGGGIKALQEEIWELKKLIQ
ncbi:MAG: hypothetical protein L6R38_002492 [Xanthoria sp. 2 TBL-2021]|nr:MAG: hypothetical protein L6R38_002492 [Xanthoria sp. 2 TBL-2021]